MYINTVVFVFMDHQTLTKDTWIVAVYVAVVQDERDAFKFSHLMKEFLYIYICIILHHVSGYYVSTLLIKRCFNSLSKQ